MSRNKENIPLELSHRQNGSLLPSKYLSTNDEFFTDSLLDATRLSSKIPTPSPHKPSLTKPRRARNNRATRNAQHSNHRQSASESVPNRSHVKSLQPSTPRKTGVSPSRLRTNSLTTPPGYRSERPLPSPYSSISSPPPQDLTNTYRQIDAEADLAETERELSSSDESGLSQVEEVKLSRFVQRSKSESPLKAPQPFTLPSRASTPTRSLGSVNRDEVLNNITRSLSEASGLSFAKEVTDPGLASMMASHFSESARDRATLSKAQGSSQKPVVFSKAIPLNKLISRNSSSIPVAKHKAFTHASKPLPYQSSYDNQDHDHNEIPISQSSRPESQQSNGNAHDTGGQPHRGPPVNPRAERPSIFGSNFGFPRRPLTEHNLEQQDRGSPDVSPSLRSQHSATSLLTDRSGYFDQVIGKSTYVPNGLGGTSHQISRSAQIQQDATPREPSQIDWTAAGADVPRPSVESQSAPPENTDGATTSLSRLISPEKNRRWDNDFTGQSFQVSESPPVRPKPANQEQQRHKEILGIAKKAVTTNRLSEIRERQSQENLRSASRSPAPRSASRSSDSRMRLVQTEPGGLDSGGEPLSDTPVATHRSASSSSSDKVTKPAVAEQPDTDKSNSLDQLQRLARAISTTPRSSPASAADPPKSATQQNFSGSDKDNKTKISIEFKDVATTEKPIPVPVAQTPKVVGAWTDTILPDTIKTVKQTGKTNGYLQTPHVSAGGWVDTPAPPDLERHLVTIPTIVEEVPEDLTAGFVKDTTSSDTITVEVPPNVKVEVVEEQKLERVTQPKSALASILDKQKQRLVSQDIVTATREDTLNLGNDTIESLQDLLALDENDLTTLSRLSLLDDESVPLSEIQAESELLERLGVKLDRLRTNIHDARKGISKLEHQVSKPPTAVVATTPQQLLSDTVCTECNQQTFQPHVHPQMTSKYFPHALLTVNLPIPLLFHPRSGNQRIPRPTMLGAITLSIWTWYLIECTMCELYCRPAHTDVYVWPTEKEPEFPFVLPTMLGRWTGMNNVAPGWMFTWTWNLIARLVLAVWRVVEMSFGWSDGFVADVRASESVKRIVETATSIAADATMLDMSMNDDEYI